MRRAANPDWDTHTVRTTLSPSPWPSLSLRGRGVAPPRAEWIPPARCTAAMAVHGGAWGLPLLEGEGRGEGKGWAGSDSCPETRLADCSPSRRVARAGKRARPGWLESRFNPGNPVPSGFGCGWLQTRRDVIAQAS